MPSAVRSAGWGLAPSVFVCFACFVVNDFHPYWYYVLGSYALSVFEKSVARLNFCAEPASLFMEAALDSQEKAHEQVLVLRCQAGEHEAFASLFERYYGPLKYYLRRLLDNPETADDALQTVWLKAFRGIARLRQPAAFRMWLYRIARNEAMQHLRRNPGWTEIEEKMLPADPGGESDDPPATDAARVHAALEKLSPSHREVLVLRFMEGLSYEEIAGVVNCEPGTVRSRLHYAKGALRRILKEHSNGG